jgi:hypothetical protein
VAAEVGRATAPALEIEFVGGFYRFPLPRCRVWSVHLQPSGPRRLAITKEFLRIGRVSVGDSALLGLSLYRAVGLPSGLFGFVALAPGRDPAEIFAARREDAPSDALAGAKWQGLRVRWVGGHVDAASPVAIYPRAAFWARSHVAPRPPRASRPAPTGGEPATRRPRRGAP